MKDDYLDNVSEEKKEELKELLRRNNKFWDMYAAANMRNGFLY